MRYFPRLVLFGCSIYLILTMVQELYDFYYPDKLWAMFAGFPPWLFYARFWFSIFWRLLLLTAALGLLFRKEFFRQAVVGIELFLAFTVFFRHPYSAFVNISRYLKVNPADFDQTIRIGGHEFYPVVLSRMLMEYAWDILTAVVIVLLLSIPPVRELFNDKS